MSPREPPRNTRPRKRLVDGFKYKGPDSSAANEEAIGGMLEELSLCPKG
jgi:hypothetical protein